MTYLDGWTCVLLHLITFAAFGVCPWDSVVGIDVLAVKAAVNTIAMAEFEVGHPNLNGVYRIASSQKVSARPFSYIRFVNICNLDWMFNKKLMYTPNSGSEIDPHHFDG
ncbi:hypothetical protein LA080_004601 [Diaporthe eres]|nr:hypothetical protein LA080_004601 [Diaporthe eres]